MELEMRGNRRDISSHTRPREKGVGSELLNDYVRESYTKIRVFLTIQAPFE